MTAISVFALILTPSHSAGESADPFADAVVSAQRGSEICGNPIPQNTLGPTDSQFFDICGAPGFIILEFTDRCLVDGHGADLRIVELTPPPSIEAATIEISLDGKDFLDLGIAASLASSGENAVTDFDIGVPGVYRFVRVEDLQGTSEWPFFSGGFDLDSVEALHTRPCPDITKRVSPPVWGMLGRNVGRTGFSPHRPALPEWTEHCTFAVGFRIFDPPVLGHDGSLILGDEDGGVYRLDADCNMVWSSHVTGPVVSPALAHDGTVIVPSGDGTLYAFTPDGALRWTFTTGAFIDRPAVVPPGIVYVSSHDGFLYALDLDGRELWRFFAGGALSWPAVAPDGMIVVAPVGGLVYALDPHGRLLWTAATGCTGQGAFCEHRPAVGADGTVYVGADDGLVYAFDRRGSLWWTYDTGMVNSEPGLALGPDGRVFVASHTGLVVALDGTGQERWTYPAGASLGAPVLGGTRWIVTGDEDGELAVLDPHGTERFTFQADGFIRWGVSVGRDGSLAFGTYGGTVYLLRSA